jgi:hypothetical protein
MEEYGENETDVLGVLRQASPIPNLSSLSSSSSSSSSSFSFFLFSPHEGLYTTVVVNEFVHEGVSPSRGGSGYVSDVVGDPHRMRSFCLE